MAQSNEQGDDMTTPDIEELNYLKPLLEARKTFTDRIANMNYQYIDHDGVYGEMRKEIEKIDNLLLKLTEKDRYEYGGVVPLSVIESRRK